MDSEGFFQFPKPESLPTPAFPKDGKFSVILADPPWRYEHPAVGSPNRRIENHYPTMGWEEIASLKDCNGLSVTNLFADDCALFLWSTSPKLAEAMKVLEAWGLSYRTCLVWVKHAIGTGYYARQRHELLLVATQGKPAKPDYKNRPDSVIVSPRERHSRKPVKVYYMLERMYPDLPKLELFARKPQRPGWHSWGNECPPH